MPKFGIALSVIPISYRIKTPMLDPSLVFGESAMIESSARGIVMSPMEGRGNPDEKNLLAFIQLQIRK